MTDAMGREGDRERWGKGVERKRKIDTEKQTGTGSQIDI